MQRYWFKRKKYGYGWQPTTWEGWLVTILYFAAIGFTFWYAPESVADEEAVQRDILLPIGVFTLLLIAVAWRTGEPLKWRWGETSDER